ncbi:MAG: DUF4281 domain-containing protein [Polyangiaceae bacterium]|jgi:hypothetical protein|nr:DUF4281 domain-containing protein [Polyangiaceae bacterium]MBK8938524.1 DUF4281 domain-containing protein [Polyangiaceae bacterium]
MSNDAIFLVCNYSVVPFWLALVFAPRSKWAARLVHSALPAALLVPAYALLLWGDDPGPQGASFFTLAGVRRIFTSDRTIIACWIHYLVFDLFVAAWQARDAARRGIGHLWTVPCLVMTLLFGPVGFGLFLALRAWKTRTLTLDERG